MDSFTNTFSLDIKFRFGISVTVILIYALHKRVSESQVSYLSCDTRCDNHVTFYRVDYVSVIRIITSTLRNNYL